MGMNFVSPFGDAYDTYYNSCDDSCYETTYHDPVPLREVNTWTRLKRSTSYNIFGGFEKLFPMVKSPVKRVDMSPERNFKKSFENKQNNLYVKNFGYSFSEADLYDLFQEYGNITSYTIMRDRDGLSKGFGFVAFSEAWEAQDALAALHNYPLGCGKTLYVSEAQKKEQRQVILNQRNVGAKVFIENITDDVTKNMVLKTFERYGKILSLEMQRKTKLFSTAEIVYSSPKESKEAFREMDKRRMGLSKQFVTVAFTESTTEEIEKRAMVEDPFGENNNAAPLEDCYFLPSSDRMAKHFVNFASGKMFMIEFERNRLVYQELQFPPLTFTVGNSGCATSRCA
ncbi:hypothetical protein L596_024799 [Steinernema carpocapsae]|uniref:RRM domain-containing protein n=1 Tax=Steinernema carpocapsae TaxID=34508 RepID=A0A4U5M5U1_STECR|nr:hypothetical protein L596_024799 [Steinernema carpocapsae]